MSRRREIGRDVASLIEDGVAGFDRHFLDELTNAELVPSDYFNAHNIFIRVEVQHHQTFFGAEGFCRDHLRIAQADVSGGGFGVDLDHRRFGDRNDETLNAALPSIR